MNINKKICILTSAHPVFDVRIFHKQAKSLAQAGYRVVLIASHDKDELIDNVNIIHVRKPASRLRRMLFFTWAVFKKARKVSADIYHFHDPELILPGLLLRLLGNKVIYDVHEDYELSLYERQYIPKFLRRVAGKLFALIENMIVRYFSGVVSATDDIHRKYSAHKHSVVVRNYPFVPPHIPKSETRAEDVTRLVYIGGLIDINGIAEIVEAMTYLDETHNISLDLWGKFSDPVFEKRVKTLAGFKYANYRGFIDFREMPKILADAHVGLVCCHPVPNSINSLPNKMFEYMSAGIAVIASDFPLWKKLIEQSGCGLCVNPLDPKDIARAVMSMHNNRDECVRMGMRGRQGIEEVYNWRNEEMRLLEFYREVI